MMAQGVKKAGGIGMETGYHRLPLLLYNSAQ